MDRPIPLLSSRRTLGLRIGNNNGRLLRRQHRCGLLTMVCPTVLTNLLSTMETVGSRSGLQHHTHFVVNAVPGEFALAVKQVGRSV
mmetsp:Transcript_63172/g.117529  ORF Transcript_63172/g.117529 Transcript_63172/m.117529 type:complete len:86 (+) Transcript_63172:94-351(+)